MPVDYFESRIGLIKIECDEKEIIEVCFVDEKEEINASDLTEKAKKELWEYFIGKRLSFDLPLRLNGTEFQEKVWNELLKIPYGKTVSYKEIAERIGSPKACRAVGNANNKNKIAILIPCHRVVGANRQLVGYAGGLVRKKALLEHEKEVMDLV